MITGAFVYDHDGFPRALELLASGRVPLDVLVEADDVPLDGLLDAAIGLHEGTARGEGDDRSDQRRRDAGMTATEHRSRTGPRFGAAQAAPQPRRDEPVTPTCSTRSTGRLLADFYGDVFGFYELPMMTEDRQRLVFQVHNDRAVRVPHRRGRADACPRLDHLGLSVGAESELDDILARAQAWQARDDRVDIIDKKTDDHGMLAIT